MRLEQQEAGGVPRERAFSSCHVRTQIHNLNSGQRLLFLWETAQVLAWYFLWRSGRWKMRVFSCQPPEDTQELGTRKTVFPFYPAKEPRDIWAKFLYLHWENKIRTFQHCRTESIASSFPPLTWPLLGLKNHLCCDKEKLSGMMLTDLRCASVVRGRSPQRHLKPRTPASLLPEAPSPLSHILGSHQDLPFSLQKLTQWTKKIKRPQVFVTMTQVCAAHVSSVRESPCTAPNPCKTSLLLQDSWHLKDCWAIKVSSLMTGSYSTCSH